jgi:CHAT domain-containing protein
MAPHLQRSSFATATLLLSLTFPLQLVETLIKIPVTPAHAQSDEAQGDRSQFLCQSNYDDLKNNSKQAEERLQSLEQELKRYQATGNRQSEAEVLECLAFTSNELGQYERAVKAYEQLLALVQERGDTREEARVLDRLTSIYGGLGDSEFRCEVIHLDDPIWAQKTIQSYEQKIKYYQSTGNRWGEGAVKDCLADIYYEALNQPERAIELFKQVLAWEQELASVSGVVHRDNFLCELPDDLQNNPSQAQARLQSLEQELKRHQATGNRWGKMDILSCLASTYKYVGKFDFAIEFLQQELVLKREISKKLKALGWKLGLSQAEAQTLNDFGSSYELLQLPSRAITFYEQFLAIAQEIGEREQEKVALKGLANAYFRLDQYIPAIAAYEQLVVLAQKSGEPYEEASILENLVKPYEELNQYERVIEIYKRLLVLTRQFGNRPGKVWIGTTETSLIDSLGKTYLKLGQNNQAINFFEEQLLLAQRKGDGTETPIIYSLGETYLQLGQYDRAFKLFEQQLVLARKQGNRGSEISALNYLASAYISQGQKNRGIEILQEQLVLAQELSRRCREQLKDKQDIYNQMFCHRAEEKTLNNLGDAYLMVGNYNRAIEIYKQILAFARKNRTPEIEMITLNRLSLALFKSGSLAEAETASRSALDILEEMWKGFMRMLFKEDSVSMLSSLDGQQPLFKNLQRVLIAENKPTQALEIAEQSRSWVLVSLLTRMALQRRTQNQANSTEIQRYDLPAVTPIGIEKIKQIAQIQNATLVEYSIVYDEFLYIWVVKPTGEVAFEQVDLKSPNTSLKDLITNTRQSIGARGRSTLEVSFEPTSDQSDRLKQLHKLLIEPIAKYLPTDPNDRVIFIPQNELFSVPFPALQDNGGKYLSQKHTILTAPATQVLQLTHHNRQNRGTGEVVVVGNPTMPSITIQPGKPAEKLSNLPGTEKEATAIALLFSTKAITGSQATKAAILPKLSKARIIHLATHGLLDDLKGLGLPGAIALAPNGTGKLNDGLLTANEIFDLDLNAELVVLSACDTGRGQITADGVIGLSRSLVTAGVPSVIVSLWSVPDAPTASLMTRFYQNLQKNPDKAQALRQAMLTTMETHPNPKDWAAFTLIGEAQ